MRPSEPPTVRSCSRSLLLSGCALGVAWLLASSPAHAAKFRVNWVQELSNDAVWRFELINGSVDTLDVQQITVTFYAEDRRLWSLPVAISPSFLRREESG